MKHRISCVLSAAGLLLLASCDSTSPNPNAGTVTFGFSGSVVGSGNFNATGAVSPGNPTTTASWAVGEVDEAEGLVFVGALQTAAGGTYHSLTLEIFRTTAGNVTVDENCTTNCSEIVLGLSVDDSGTPEFLCAFEAGSITISSISETRATGSFNGTGTCIDFVTFSAAGTITITNGSFDVALLAGASNL